MKRTFPASALRIARFDGAPSWTLSFTLPEDLAAAVACSAEATVTVCVPRTRRTRRFDRLRKGVSNEILTDAAITQILNEIDKADAETE